MNNSQTIRTASRSATREDRWRVGKAAGPRPWYAGPTDGRVMAQMWPRKKRYVFFPSWAEAMAYAVRRVYSK